MLRLLKITCISAICFIMLSGCSARQEKIERTETNQLEQSKIEKKVSESNEEETLDLSGNFNGITGCAVYIVRQKTSILCTIKIWQNKKYPHIQLLKLSLH